MANNLERAARDALTYLEDVIPRSLLTKDLRAALDAPLQPPTREQYAAAIWGAINQPVISGYVHTWDDVCECSPYDGFWKRHHERSLRRADAVMALVQPAPDLMLALKVAVRWRGSVVEVPGLSTALDRIIDGTATSADWRVINQAGSQLD